MKNWTGLQAKCLICNDKTAELYVNFDSKNEKFFYCEKHKAIKDPKFVEFVFNEKPIRNKHENAVLTKLCPVVQYEGKHFRHSCKYPHNNDELSLWKYLVEQNITIEDLMLQVTSTKPNSNILVETYNLNQNLFDIVNEGQLDEILTFLKKNYYSDILNQRMESSSQSILHVACEKRNIPLIHLLNNPSKLRKCFRDTPIINTDERFVQLYSTFFNLCDKNDDSALEIYIKSSLKTSSILKYYDYAIAKSLICNPYYWPKLTDDTDVDKIIKELVLKVLPNQKQEWNYQFKTSKENELINNGIKINNSLFLGCFSLKNEQTFSIHIPLVCEFVRDKSFETNFEKYIKLEPKGPSSSHFKDIKTNCSLNLTEPKQCLTIAVNVKKPTEITLKIDMVQLKYEIDLNETENILNLAQFRTSRKSSKTDKNILIEVLFDLSKSFLFKRYGEIAICTDLNPLKKPMLNYPYTNMVIQEVKAFTNHILGNFLQSRNISFPILVTEPIDDTYVKLFLKNEAYLNGISTYFDKLLNIFKKQSFYVGYNGKCDQQSSSVSMLSCAYNYVANCRLEDEKISSEITRIMNILSKEEFFPSIFTRKHAIVKSGKESYKIVNSESFENSFNINHNLDFYTSATNPETNYLDMLVQRMIVNQVSSSEGGSIENTIKDGHLSIKEICQNANKKLNYTKDENCQDKIKAIFKRRAFYCLVDSFTIDFLVGLTFPISRAKNPMADYYINLKDIFNKNIPIEIDEKEKAIKFKLKYRALFVDRDNKIIDNTVAVQLSPNFTKELRVDDLKSIRQKIAHLTHHDCDEKTLEKVKSEIRNVFTEETSPKSVRAEDKKIFSNLNFELNIKLSKSSCFITQLFDIENPIEYLRPHDQFDYCINHKDVYDSDIYKKTAILYNNYKSKRNQNRFARDFFSQTRSDIESKEVIYLFKNLTMLIEFHEQNLFTLTKVKLSKKKLDIFLGETDISSLNDKFICCRCYNFRKNKKTRNLDYEIMKLPYIDLYHGFIEDIKMDEDGKNWNLSIFLDCKRNINKTIDCYSMEIVDFVQLNS